MCIYPPQKWIWRKKNSPANRPRNTWCGKCVAMKTREMQTLIWMIQKAIHRQDLKRRKLQRTDKTFRTSSKITEGIFYTKPTTPLQILHRSDGRAGSGEVKSRGDHHIPHTWWAHGMTRRTSWIEKQRGWRRVSTKYCAPWHDHIQQHLAKNIKAHLALFHM